MTSTFRRAAGATLLAFAAVAALAACSSSGGAHVAPAHSAPAATTSIAPVTAKPVPRAQSPRRAASTAAPVHISLQFADGSTLGVGAPVIAQFSQRFTDASALQAATTVTVNGRVTGGGWYFIPSTAPGSVLEGHYRLHTYWPAHAHIVVTIAAKGVWAGAGLGFDDTLSTDFHTGAAQTMVVDGTTHTLTLTVDGRRRAVYPVSLGGPGHPTISGTKVVMAREAATDMRGPGYFVAGVPWTERLTWGGEYLHSATWNVYNIEHGIDSSHGCTNLRIDDAKALYDRLRVGDVVSYVHIREATSPMTMADGWGDWNIPWSTWLHDDRLITTTA